MTSSGDSPRHSLGRDVSDVAVRAARLDGVIHPHCGVEPVAGLGRGRDVAGNRSAVGAGCPALPFPRTFALPP